MKQPKDGKIEPMMILLFAGMVMFSILLLVVERFWAADGQLFQVFASLLTGFSGAFFMRAKPKEDGPKSSMTVTGDSASITTSQTADGGPPQQ